MCIRDRSITVRFPDDVVALSANDDFFNNYETIMTTGVAAGNVRTVSDYTGSTRTATFGSNWTNTPGPGDAYTIYDPAFWAASIGAGKAYINGFEVEFNKTTVLPAPRARDFINVNGASLYAPYGNFLKVDSLQGAFNTTTHETCLLYTSPSPRDS